MRLRRSCLCGSADCRRRRDRETDDEMSLEPVVAGYRRARRASA
jgi:hypothetical protein